MGTENRQPPTDHAVRREITTSLGKSMLVEAAAGTGKTTLLMDRMLRGLKRGAFRLPRTVAITFTEKAAGELETRLRTTLSRTLRKGDLSPTERQNLDTALDEIDRVNVSTIHSFCAGLLRERPVDAGVDPEFEVLDAVRSGLLAQECWERWMAEQVQESPEPFVDALRAGVSTEAGRGSSGLRGLAWALMATPEALDPTRTSLPTPDSSRSELAERLRQFAPQVRSFMGTHLKTGGNKTYHRVIEFLHDVEDSDDLSRVCRLACSFPASKADKALTSLEKDARERAEELLDELGGIADLISAHLAGEVFDWLSGFARFYAEEKRRRSVLDFQDLLVLAARMLKTRPAVRTYYKRRFDAFFVDEFQDTDPLQAEIVAYLCERPEQNAERMEEVELQPGKLFVVGDPKQSIYRFRRADVQTYERFKDLMKDQGDDEASVRQVHCNFRSTRPVLDELNDVFSQVFVPAEAEGVYQAEHVALSAPPDAPVKNGEAGITALCPPPDLQEEMDSAGTARDYEAHYLALAIKSMVEDEAGEMAYGDFACLFRAMTDVEKYEDAFEKYGVPYRVVGGRTYYRTEEIGETIAVLRAIDDPLDQPAIVGALRSSYFGVSDEELLDFKRRGGTWNYLQSPQVEGAAGEAMSVLKDWHRRRNTVPPHVLLEEVLHRTKALESFLLKPQGRQRTANVKKLLGQLRSVWKASHGSFGGVVGYLNSLQEREAREEESSVVEPGDDFVQIMTIHKSKGLQFPCVVIPDLSRRLPDSTDPVLLDRSSGRVEVSVSSSVASQGYEQLSEVESSNLQAEYGRLLYVACTRAEERLILPLYWQRSGRRTPRNSLLSILESTGIFEPAGDVPCGEQVGGVHYVETEPWQSRVSLRPTPQARVERGENTSCESLLGEREEWQSARERLLSRARSAPSIVSPSALDGKDRPAVVGVDEEGVAGGQAVGSLFHHVMRRIPLTGDTAGSEFRRLVQQTAEHQAAQSGLTADEVSQTVELACSTARNADFRHLLNVAESVGREVPFCVPLDQLPFEDVPANGFLEGSIDLLIAGPDGNVVLDYKTDVAAESNREELEHHYWPQLALYALACDCCGWAPRSPELVLYFVRPGVLCRRRLDDELLRRVRESLQEQCAE